MGHDVNLLHLASLVEGTEANREHEGDENACGACKAHLVVLKLLISLLLDARVLNEQAALAA